MSVDTHNSKINIPSQLEVGKAYSTKEIATLVGIPVSNLRQKLQRLHSSNELLKHTVNNVTYWAINPKK